MSETFVKLYVTGRNTLADRAQQNLRRVNELKPDLRVEVVDILEDPDAAESERIVATPLLVRIFPAPEKRLFGDMSDTDVVLSELGLGGLRTRATNRPGEDAVGS